MEPGGPTRVQGRGLRLSRFERACLLVVAAAFLFRLWYALHPIVLWDSAWLLTLARSFGDTGTFLVPWYEQPGYSGYWPPLFPIYASPFVALLGPGYRTLVVAATVASALLVLATFLCTRDLLGRTRAFAAVALVAASPAFLVSDAQGTSESLLALTVVLAVWAFLRGLERPAFLPLAALCAFLAYLAKASLGLPLVALGLLAVALWRVRVRGWRRVVRSPMDLGLGAAALALLVLLALTRTDRLGGLGVGLLDPVRATLAEPLWLPVFLFKLVFAAAFLLAVTAPLSLRVVDAWRAPRTEASGALWLATLLPLAAGAVFSTSFYFHERRALVDFDNVRYLTPSLVPFLWLLLPHWPAEAAAAPEGKVEGARLRRRHEAAFTLAAGSVVALLLLNPVAVAASVPRLLLFAALALVPLGFALAALRAHVEVVPRRNARGETEHRYAPARPPPGTARTLLAVLAVAALAAFVVSSWYVGVALGLAVALAAMSPRAQVVCMALVLLAATAPSYDTRDPVEEVARETGDLLPPGSVVRVTETAVYVAAVAPEGLVVREGFPGNGTVEDAILYAHYRPPPEGGFPGFHPVKTWSRSAEPSPPLRLRLALEEALLGVEHADAPWPAYTLYLRD